MCIRDRGKTDHAHRRNPLRSDLTPRSRKSKSSNPPSLSLSTRPQNTTHQNPRVSRPSFTNLSNGNKDANAALALVSARSPTTTSVSAPRQATSNIDDQDVDLKRAQDLLDLHANVKVAHRGGLDQDLLRAREDVRRALLNV